MEQEKPFRVSLKITDGKPHTLYLTQLKEIMASDNSLHPMMEKTLKMLKKTRTPYIMLATLREVVIDGKNFRHFDRSADPKGDWVCTLWSNQERKDHKDNPEEHVVAILKLFESLGYDIYNFQECSLEYLKSLEDLTLEQIEAQLKQREGFE